MSTGIMIGASDEPVEVPPNLFISGRQSILGWYSGSSIDSQDTLSFSALSGVRSINEIFSLEQAAQAYELMISGKVLFRAVLTTGYYLAPVGGVLMGLHDGIGVKHRFCSE